MHAEYQEELKKSRELAVSAMTRKQLLRRRGFYKNRNKMNKLIQTLKNRLIYSKEAKTHVIDEDIDCEVTDEIEKALWVLKEDMDLPTEEVQVAVDSRKKCKNGQ